MNKYQKSLIDFMKTGEIEIELRHLSQRQLIRLVEEQQQRIDKAIEYINQHTEQRIYQEPYNIDGYPDRVEYFIEGKWNLLSILRGEE